MTLTQITWHSCFDRMDDCVAGNYWNWLLMQSSACCVYKYVFFLLFLLGHFHFKIPSKLCAQSVCLSSLGQKGQWTILFFFLIANKNSLLVLWWRGHSCALRERNKSRQHSALLQSIRYPPRNKLGFRGRLHKVKGRDTTNHVQASTGVLSRAEMST